VVGVEREQDVRDVDAARLQAEGKLEKQIWGKRWGREGVRAKEIAVPEIADALLEGSGGFGEARLGAPEADDRENATEHGKGNYAGLLGIDLFKEIAQGEVPALGGKIHLFDQRETRIGHLGR
jgi:hypothetical protein